MKLRLLLPAMLALLCCACVTHIRPNVTYNPPPTERLSNFQHFLLEPIAASTQASSEDYAVRQIQTYMNQRVSGTLVGWENHNDDGRTLVIQPYIDELKFVGSGARFFAGALAGSSAVLMHVELTDARTGRVIGSPEFYQRAAASGGNWSIGGTDHGMLARIATVVQEYLQRNYARAVGGPTGLDGTEPD
jgi:hypothetical protein